MRHNTFILKIFLLLLLFVSVSVEGDDHDKKQIVLATSEREPYIGRLLEEQGYVHELVTLAFERVGYELTIKYYPVNRAKRLSETGFVSGLLPTNYDESLLGDFIFSSPFPGDNVGLLKKKELPVKFGSDPRIDIKRSLQDLRYYSFGLVRGTEVESLFSSVPENKKFYINDDVQNLDILAAGRIDFAVIDKYTAADLMVGYRPHLIGQLDFMRPPMISRPFHIAFSKHFDNYQLLASDFNRGLELVKKDGQLAELLSKHGLTENKDSSSDKTTLTIATVNNRDMVVMQELSEQYEALHPDIDLEWRILDETVLRRRLLSDLAIDDGRFDVMTIGGFEAPIWAEHGWLSPLSNLSDEYDLNDMLTTVKGMLSYQDQVYALPFYAESSMTFYRTDVFEQAGLTMPKQPSFEDIKRLAAKVHEPEHDFYGLCLRGNTGWGANMTIVNTMVNAYGGRWFDNDWQPLLDSPEWHQAVEMYIDLVRNYGPPNVTSNGFNQNLELFSNGQCAMWIDATVAAGLLFNPQKSKVHQHVGFTSAPIAVTDKGSHWLWVWSLAIPESSKHKKEALAFIEWATSKNYIEKVAQQEGWQAVPPGTRKSTYANKSYQSAAPFADFVLNAIQTADPVDSTRDPKPYLGIQAVSIPEYPALGNQVSQQIVNVIEGKTTIDAALRQSQKLVKKQMQRSGYYQQK